MFGFERIATARGARSGRLTLPHGEVRTPAFMPVGTQGTVKGLAPDELSRAGAQIILGNTYHLHLRPGEDVVRELGGLHRFTTWPRSILTDSGGFQVFSLESMRTVTDDGVTFRSHIDGSRRFISPERAVEIQWALGPDIAMAFDHVIPGEADRATAADALDRTIRWLQRCLHRHTTLADEAPGTQTLWPIVQGGTFDDLRQSAVSAVRDLGDWTGVAIGGLAVGEGKEKTLRVLDGLAPTLPEGIPRYLMGVGFPEDLLRSIARGVDLFDCVVPTRNGRHGTAFTRDGPVILRNAAHRVDDAPIDRECDCEVCGRFSRAYLICDTCSSQASHWGSAWSRFTMSGF